MYVKKQIVLLICWNLCNSVVMKLCFALVDSFGNYVVVKLYMCYISLWHENDMLGCMFV